MCIPKNSLPRRRTFPWMTKKFDESNQENIWCETEPWRSCGRSRVISSEISIQLAHKHFWKPAKILNKNNVSIPALVRNGTSTVTKDFDKDSMLNQYFSECFNIAQPPLSTRYEEPNIGNYPEDFLCTEDEVYGKDSDYTIVIAIVHWLKRIIILQKLTSVVEFWAVLFSHWTPLLIDHSCDVMCVAMCTLGH